MTKIFYSATLKELQEMYEPQRIAYFGTLGVVKVRKGFFFTDDKQVKHLKQDD